MLAPPSPAETSGSQGASGRLPQPPLIQDREEGRFSRVLNPYRAPAVSPIDLSNSNRLESLLRAGNLYLSLQDAIALALENNLDIAVQRYGPALADASVLRARAGGFARGVSTSVQNGPTSATQGTAAQTGINSNAATQTSNAASQAGSTFITQTGSAIPNLDPSLNGFARWNHSSIPQSSAFITGTNAFVQRQDLSNFKYSQGFLTGTTFDLGYSNTSVASNNRSADFNPSTSGSLSLNISQHLLQGFGVAVNNRQIRIGKNQREISDLVFKAQVITTVSAVMNLYWDLVSFNDDVKYRKEALAQSQKLYEDNQKQVEIGTLAPIAIVQAEAELAGRQQDLILSQTQVLQQETIIKNALSRTGIASPAVADAHIIPTDRIRMPAQEAIQPFQDMVADAFRARPELSQRRIQVEDQKISLKGSKSALLPQLDAVVSIANNGLIGDPSALPVLPGRARAGTPFFIGGYGTLFTQIFSRNFPDYGIGFNLNIPLRNRAAQADIINDELTLRQQQLGLQQLENQVRVEVQNTLIGLQQARARYQAATKQRYLQEQTLDAEQKKFALGASTIYNVILIQRDLVQAQAAEVTALSAYSKARVEMDRATGQTLANNNISIDEAFRGVVSRPPSPLPVLDQAPAVANPPANGTGQPIVQQPLRP